MNFVEVFNYAVLLYFIIMELQLVILAFISYRALRADQFSSRFGRIHDMLSSDTTPPVSIIIPAYNEAAGIAESVRSMAMLKYAKKEIIVVNDGSTDDTLQQLIDEFRMEPVDTPYRARLETQPVRRTYRSRLPLPIVVVDKDNGGKGDAINAGINVSRCPYVMATDADMVLDEECLLRAVRHFVEDRARTVAVGGNVRPLNGCEVRRGRVTNVSLPKRPIEMVQVVEYIRSFLAARPAWSALGSLLIVSGAFGIFKKEAVVDVGGYQQGHLGEDMELTMRLHRYYRKQRKPYRIVYAPDAVAWTEVPTTREVLRKQRIRWHRGLMQVVWQYRGMLFNPRYGIIGMIAWPSFVAFEFLAPIVEVIGWVVVPASLALGLLNLEIAIPLILVALAIGTANSLIGLILDERFGYYEGPGEAWRLLVYSVGEQLGLRQRTVWWRVRAMFWNPRRKVWGDMQRTGVGNLSREVS
ncbi:MAG: glycosyltransferase [Gammaproteobacteria bacterium]|nr:glycosyltransferase [Gammaproteobacteria bacterium]